MSTITGAHGVVGTNSSPSGGDGGTAYAPIIAYTYVPTSETITGGVGGDAFGYPTTGSGGNGGTGIALPTGDSVQNSGTILGGAGGYADNGVAGGSGGIGVSLQGGGLLTNEFGGIITGGNAGAGGFPFGGTPGGTGGDAVKLASGGTVDNAGSITGGIGGATGSDVEGSGGAGGTGGIGVELVQGGYLDNPLGVITGGMGGLGGDGSPAGGPGGTGGVGVALDDGGSIANHADIRGGVGGTGSNISPLGNGGNGGAGVVLTNGGTLTNYKYLAGGAGGSPGGSGAVGGSGGAGVIVDTSNAVVVNSGGIYGGAGGSTAAGGIGVDFVKSGTVDNAGSIVGGTGNVTGDAVYFGAGASRVVIVPGASFIGQVVAKNLNNVIELYAGGTGSISHLDTQFTDFQTLSVDGGAVWDITGSTTLDPSLAVVNNGTLSEGASDALTIGGSLSGIGVINLDPTALTLNGFVGAGQTIEFTGTGDTLKLGHVSNFAGTISGFTIGDGLDLTSVPFGSITGDNFNHGTGVLTVYDSSGNLTFHFANPGNYNGDYFHLAAYGGGTAITESTTPCFCPGTLILTPCGEVAVEGLAIGDWVITESGEAEPIKWIGRHSCAGPLLAAGKSQSLPIRICANALADGLPRRDLRVSPLHALSIDGVLVPAGELVNGVSILQEAVARVDYIHIELASHALIFAEGAATETFIDDNSRQLFDNADEYARLYPNEERTAAQFCAERLSEGYDVEAIRWRLADRAATLWPSRQAKAA